MRAKNITATLYKSYGAERDWKLSFSDEKLGDEPNLKHNPAWTYHVYEFGYSKKVRVETVKEAIRAYRNYLNEFNIEPEHPQDRKDGDPMFPSLENILYGRF